MVKYLFILIILIVGITIINSRGEKRLAYTLCGVFFFRSTYFIWSGISAQAFVMLCYFISLYRQGRLNVLLREFPFRSLLGIYFIVTLLLYLHTDFLSIGQKLARPIFDFNIPLMLLLGYTIVCCETEMIKYVKTYARICIVFGLYGVLTYITNRNPYEDLMVAIDSEYFSEFYGSVDAVAEGFYGGARGLRVGGVLGNSHVWGGVCAMMALVLFSLREHLKKNVLYLGVLLLLMNVILSQARAAILCAAFGAVVYLALMRGSSKKVFYAIGAFGLLYVTVSSGLVNIGFISSALDDNNAIESGSSMELKQTQLEGAILYMMQNPLWGNGMGYIREVLLEKGYDRTLMGGFEGLHLVTMVEGGLIYSALILYLFAKLFSYFVSLGLRHNMCIGAFSLLCLYSLNAVAVGANGRTEFAYFFVGMYAAFYKIMKQQEI